MPKDGKRLNAKDEQTAEEIADKKFHDFFSMSVAQIPSDMKHRDDEEPEPKRGLFSRLFRRDRSAAAPESDPEPEKPQELPTGEISLTAPPNELQANLEPAWEPLPEEPAPNPEPVSVPEPEAPAAEPPQAAPSVAAPSVPEQKAEPAPAPAPQEIKTDPACQPAPRTALEQRADEEMRELKAMLNGTYKPKPQPKVDWTGPEEPLPTPVFTGEQGEPAKKEEPSAKESPAAPAEQVEPAKEEKLPEPPAPEQPPVQQPPVEQNPEPKAEQENEKKDPVPPVREEEPRPDDAMNTQPSAEGEAAPPEPIEPVEPESAETLDTTDASDTAETPETTEETETSETGEVSETPAETETPQATETEPAPKEPSETAAAAGSAAEAPAEAAPADREAQEEANAEETAGQRLHRMGATLTLRCVLSGILAIVLLHFGLVAEGLMAPMASLDPALAPAAFYAANLLFYAAALVAAFPVLRDGLEGLRGRPSADTMPALAACGALIEAAVALLNAQTYQPSSFTLLTGVAALGLFLALLGSRLMLSAVQSGYDLAVREGECFGAYRARDKDLVRALARSLDQKDPWVLLSRPAVWNNDLVEQCLGTRASERRARKTSCLLLAASALSGLVFLLFGGGVNGMAAALTSMLCMGAPLSSTLIAGLAALRLQRTAGAAGAVVPGWAAIEELGGVDTVQVDADALFPEGGALLDDIRIFKGGRIDTALLYAASVLNLSCGTLRGLFSQIIENRTEILYPVKDFQLHRGLGYSAWCDNNRILIGSRTYMEREGVVLPEKSYEDEHTKNGSLQVLYLAVSGNLHAMFVLHSVGGRSIARGLEMLQRENIRLLVSCEDPSLTAKHIADAYHLPDGMVTILDQAQCDALAAPRPAEDAAARPETCCMIYNQGFISLSSGLRASSEAQNAETSATTVQLVSVWFSVAIGVLLTYAGSIGFLSSAAVLMYQAAWSGLCIALCALKQHR